MSGGPSGLARDVDVVFLGTSLIPFPLVYLLNMEICDLRKCRDDLLGELASVLLEGHLERLPLEYGFPDPFLLDRRNQIIMNLRGCLIV